MAEVMAWPLNLEEYAYNAEDVMRWMAGRTSGIYGQEGNWQVIAQSGMNVRVQAEGMAGGWLSNLGRYGVAFWNPTNIDLTVETADGVLPRIDRVVVSWHIPQQTSVPTVSIRKGTPASSPSGPALVNDGEYAEICLAEITVPAGATEIQGQNITDTRMDGTLCGIVSAGLEKFPTDGLNQEFQAWFENVKGQLSEDAAGNLQRQIDEQGVKKLTHTKSGTTHALTGLSGVSGTVSCVFTATAAYAAGDTFTVDGVAYTIQLSNGEEAGDNLFVSGASVPVVVDTAGKKVNFKAAGGQKLPAGTMAIVQVFTENGTFVVPKTGKYKITAIGHGGSGGVSDYGYNSGVSKPIAAIAGSGAAGGAGELIKELNVGENYPVTIDTAQTSFGSLISATAGGDGSDANAISGVAGTGGKKGISSGYSTLLPSEDGKTGSLVTRGDHGPGLSGGACNGVPGGEGGKDNAYGATPGFASVGVSEKGLPPFGTGAGSSGITNNMAFMQNETLWRVSGWIGAVIVEMVLD